MTTLAIRMLKRVLHVSTLLVIAAVLTLVGLVLMVWSMLQPTPMPVILAMSLGQGLGMLAFLLFGLAVLLDQFRKHHQRGAEEAARKVAALRAAAREAEGDAADARDASPAGRNGPPARRQEASDAGDNTPRREAPP
jgi:hypothetical protein